MWSVFTNVISTSSPSTILQTRITFILLTCFENRALSLRLGCHENHKNAPNGWRYDLLLHVQIVIYFYTVKPIIWVDVGLG